MPNQTDIDIYKPLAYFAYFGYPLTAFEIWKWQFARSYDLATRSDDRVEPLSLPEIEHGLNTSSWLREHVRSHNGFWAIGDVEQQVADRHERYLDAMDKEEKLKKALAFLRHVPGVRGVALCNSMPFHFTHEQGDIDLFVVTKPGAVWSTRLMSVAPLIALKQRPGEAKRHPIDLSFFVSESSMDLFGLQKSDDPYFAHWIATLTPVLGEQALWDRFFDENSWAFTRLPNARAPRRSYRYRCRTMKPLMPSLSESFAKRVQERRLPNDLREAANEDSRVVITSQMLKFHRTDRRDEIARAFAKQMSVCNS